MEKEWFEFKSINSMYKDVIVESLPSITRAPKRYNTTNIDGKDGTITDILGYGSYEKVIKIGLTESNNFYLDELANWLDGKGKLIMSNEPNKFYNAEILDQLDFEKALRFRKADIHFLVQPFKYLASEKITNGLTVLNQGYIDCKPKMTIYGNGLVTLYINGLSVCTLNITDYITLDSEELEATRGNELVNRNMTGEFPVFKPNVNTISFTGNVTKVETLVRSRWI
ncbi:MAG: putative phage tail component [Clostridiales bacterium]|jgi:predicted phage tail component-like protein|nr:putative phage tail component [Clostridiales bacterium]